MNDNVKTAVSCSLDILFLFFLPDGVFVCFSVIWGEKKKNTKQNREFALFAEVIARTSKVEKYLC